MKLLICDDQAIVRDGLKLMFDLEQDIEVVGLAGDGTEAMALVEEVQPDLVLMDLKMPVLNGIEATRQIVRQHPQILILVLTTYDADEWVFDAIRAGAVGYLLKDTPREKLIDAVRGTMAGRNYLDPAVTGKLIQQVSVNAASSPPSNLFNQLNERELAILHLLAKGLHNADIADNLHLSEGTVRNYVSAIFAKLDVADRTQAAVLALRHGIG